MFLVVEMADKDELRSMVLSFRVSELQVLLGLANLSKCGRKMELMERALNLVERGLSQPLQLKVRELYRKYMPQRIQVGGTGDVYGTSALQLSKSSATSQLAQGVSNGARRVAVETDLMQRVVNTNTNTANIVKPEVSLKHLPFYDVITEIMKPSCLVPRSITRLQESRLNFTLTQQHVDDINSHRNTRYVDRIDYGVQIQLRFCIVDSTSKQPDCFPSAIVVKVNNMIAQLPNVIPTNKPGVEPKRPNRPVDITRLCRLSSSIVNTIQVSWALEESRRHCAAVYLVRKLDSNILLQRLKRAGIRKPDYTIALVREKLSLDQDADIATTSLCISLLCPLGKMRMTVPCRASTCRHLQCFDAATYIMMNEKKPTWVCPVCDQPAEFLKLIIDGLVTEILKETADATEVELSRDGTWRVTKEQERDCDSPDMQMASKQPPVVHAVEKDSPIKMEPVACVTGSDFIDLTESDDEGVAMSTSTVFVPSHRQPTDGGSNSGAGVISKCSSALSSSASPRSSLGLSSPSPPVAVYDLSPLRVLPPSPPLHVSTSSPRGHQRSVSPRNLLATPPPLVPPPLTHPGFHLGYHASNAAKMSSHPLFAGSAPAFSSLASTANGSSFPYPGSLFGASPYEGLGSSGDAVLDFLSLMSGFSDYSNFTLPPNTFDYLYQSPSSAAAASASLRDASADLGLDGLANALRGASSPRS